MLVGVQLLFANKFWSNETQQYFYDRNTQDTLVFYEQKLMNADNDSATIADIYFNLGMFCYNNYYIEPALEIFQLAIDYTKKPENESNFYYYLGVLTVL